MSAPTVSVIVPTYRRPEALAAGLGALARLDAPPGGFEVIVVDDGSPEPAADVAASFHDRLDLTVVRQENAGPAFARNTGAAHARGGLLAFTDDDCRPARAWLTALTEAAATQPGALLAGRTVNGLPDNLYAEASQLLISYLYEYFGPSSGRVLLVASNNLAVPAAAFRELGGFDTTFALAAGEDRDFSARWHEAGRPAVFLPEAVVHHAHEMSLRGYWRQHAHYGQGAVHYHRRRRARGIPNERSEPPAFYLGLVGFPLRASRRPRSWLLAALLGVSQLANAVGYVRGAWRDRGDG